METCFPFTDFPVKIALFACEYGFLNLFLKSFVPAENYVEIFNLPSVVKYRDNNIYMADNLVAAVLRDVGE